MSQSNHFSPDTFWLQIRLIARSLYTGIVLGAAIGLLLSWIILILEILIWFVFYWCTSSISQLLEVGMLGGTIGGLIGSLLAITFLRQTAKQKQLVLFSLSGMIGALCILLVHLRNISIHPCTVSF